MEAVRPTLRSRRVVCFPEIQLLPANNTQSAEKIQGHSQQDNRQTFRLGFRDASFPVNVLVGV